MLYNITSGRGQLLGTAPISKILTETIILLSKKLEGLDAYIAILSKKLEGLDAYIVVHLNMSY